MGSVLPACASGRGEIGRRIRNDRAVACTLKVLSNGRSGGVSLRRTYSSAAGVGDNGTIPIARPTEHRVRNAIARLRAGMRSVSVATAGERWDLATHPAAAVRRDPRQAQRDQNEKQLASRSPHHQDLERTPGSGSNVSIRESCSRQLCGRPTPK